MARTIYLGSAPTAAAAHRGIEDRRIKLGCVMPGESPAIFGDALRRLGAAATYLYQDGPRYWYSTQPTVTKLADDRAEQYKHNTDPVVKEIDERLRDDLRSTGGFPRVHPLPVSGAEVPDDMSARLVVLGVDHPYTKEIGNRAQAAAQLILESRGNTPRLFQNSLVFLAVDEARLQDLDEAVRRFLAWESIVAEKESLNLDPQQAKQAESQLKSANSAVSGRIPEAYQWLLVPTQPSPQSPLEWQAFRLTGQEPLAVRATTRLRNEELLLQSLSGTRLRMELDRIPLWRGDSVAVKQLAEDFARYIYLPRLRDTHVLVASIKDGLGLLLWSHETFAYADSYDEGLARYRGLRCGQPVNISAESLDGLLVKPDAALKQQAAETIASAAGAQSELTAQPILSALPAKGGDGQTALTQSIPRRFHGSVRLDPARVGRDAGRVADEVIAHLEGLVGADVTVTLEIEANVPEGVPDSVVRTVTENSRTLKFASQGFEES